MLLGDTIDGKMAYEMGLADYLVTSDSEINGLIDDIQSKIDKCSPNALAITKKEMIKRVQAAKKNNQRV